MLQGMLRHGLIGLFLMTPALAAPMAEQRGKAFARANCARCHAIVKANWRFDTKLLERTYDRIGVPEIYVEVTPEVGPVESR